MGGICIMLTIGVYVLLQSGTTNGMFFFSIPRSPYSVHPSLNASQVNTNEVYRPRPFSLFFPIFRYGSPFLPVLDEGKVTMENTTNFAEKYEGPKFNDSLQDKVNDVSKEEKSGELKEHHVSKKVINFDSENTEMPFSGRYNLLSRLPYLKYFPFKEPKGHWRNKENEAQSLKHNDTQQANSTGITNESPLMVKENCTRRRFAARYVFLWSYNLVAMHLVVILLLPTVIILGLLICQQYCSTKQRGQLSKIRPICI